MSRFCITRCGPTATQRAFSTIILMASKSSTGWARNSDLVQSSNQCIHSFQPPLPEHRRGEDEGVTYLYIPAIFRPLGARGGPFSARKDRDITESFYWQQRVLEQQCLRTLLSVHESSKTRSQDSFVGAVPQP